MIDKLRHEREIVQSCRAGGLCHRLGFQPEAPQLICIRTGESRMRLLHAMIRVNDLNESLKFYCDGLGMKLLRKNDYPNGKFTLAFVGYGDERDNSVIELTHNWEQSGYAMGDAFGHLAISSDDIYRTCEELKQKGVKVVREPG